MTRYGRPFALIGALALLLAGCTGGSSTPTPAAEESAAESAAQSAAASEGAVAYPEGDLSIMAPADPGGGWDSTARAMQAALESDVVEANVEVYNVGGAGGTIGLAEFVDSRAGDPNQLMVMGLVMVGAIRTNDSPVTLDQVTPIASLTAEQEGIVVRADSDFQTLEDLVNAWSADPTSIAWSGGSAGGTDHILVGLLAQAADIDPSGINYVPYSGGGEALTAILAGDPNTTVGVSGVSEFSEQVDAGELRWLAVSGEQAPEGIDAATITDAGYDVVLDNWRGVVAAPDITDEQRAGIVQLITDMHDSEAWQQALDENGWADFFQTGDDFATFLDEERTRVEQVLTEIGLVQ